MGDQRSCAGQRVVPVASNTSTGPAIRRRVRVSATNSSRSGFVVLHSSAPGAPMPCARGRRGTCRSGSARWCRSGWSTASTWPRSGRGAVGRRPPPAGPGRVRQRRARDGSTPAVRRAAARESSRRISRRGGMPGRGGPPPPPAEPGDWVAGRGAASEQHHGHGPVHNGVPGEGRPRRGQLGAGVAGVGEDPHAGGDPPVGRRQLQRAAEQRGGDPLPPARARR